MQGCATESVDRIQIQVLIILDSGFESVGPMGRLLIIQILHFLLYKLFIMKDKYPTYH